MIRPHETLKAATLLAIAAIAAITVSAPAQSKSKRTGDHVVAESRFGNGTVVGRVRRTRVGLQVKTPGGSWIHCERSCSETLRVNSVDFWENEQGAGAPNAIDQEDGLLSRWLHWQRRY